MSLPGFRMLGNITGSAFSLNSIAFPMAVKLLQTWLLNDLLYLPMILLFDRSKIDDVNFESVKTMQ